MNIMKEIGRELVEYSQEAEAFSANRGLMDELFPYIFEASKRMSLRAIGRWLLTEHKVSVSPNTLARAMRNPEKYWIQYLENIEPYVRTVARAHNVDPHFVLSAREVILHLEGKEPAFSGAGGAEKIEQRIHDYQKAVDEINEFWSSMPDFALEECLEYVEKVFDSGDGDQEGKESESDN